MHINKHHVCLIIQKLHKWRMIAIDFIIICSPNKLCWHCLNPSVFQHPCGREKAKPIITHLKAKSQKEIETSTLVITSHPCCPTTTRHQITKITHCDHFVRSYASSLAGQCTTSWTTSYWQCCSVNTLIVLQLGQHHWRCCSVNHQIDFSASLPSAFDQLRAR